MLASPRSLSLSWLSVCTNSRRFQIKSPPAKSPALNSNGVQCKALALKTNSTCFMSAVWCLRQLTEGARGRTRDEGVAIMIVLHPAGLEHAAA